MNIYDFDGTLYSGDSSADFLYFCLKRGGFSLCWAFGAAIALFLYLIGIWSKERFKSELFSIIRSIDDIEINVREFWDTRRQKLQLPYIGYDIAAQNAIISASPEFLLSPIAKELGAELLSSRVDLRTGQWLGLNCHGAEKVRRYREALGETEIDRFYSNSLSDAPLAEFAREAFFVRGGDVIPWNEYLPGTVQKVKDMFFNPQFFQFVFCGGVVTLSNMLLSAIYAIWIDPTLAYVLGYACAIFLNYTLNSFIVFKQPWAWRRFAKFVVSYIPNFCILFAFVAVFINIFRWNHVLVYGLAAIVAIPITFTLLKIFAFRKSKGEVV